MSQRFPFEEDYRHRFGEFHLLRRRYIAIGREPATYPAARDPVPVPVPATTPEVPSPSVPPVLPDAPAPRLPPHLQVEPMLESVP